VSSVLITGASRGIGLQLCKLFAERGDAVIAVCRETNELEGQTIDTLVNNAGILMRDTFGEIDYEVMTEQFRINTLGPLRVTEALAGNLREGSKVAIISSRVGSIEDNSSGGNYGYRASKAAVNMIGTNLKHEFLPRGIAVAILHPGFVATDMTGGNGVDPADSARGLIQRIDELTLDNSGGFWHAEGYALPW
jgi:NAD(P)-dependent dehydrogenase (short-subunit alcohol dehydrogenase family)